jgi:hypothetical protein
MLTVTPQATRSSPRDSFLKGYSFFGSHRCSKNTLGIRTTITEETQIRFTVSRSCLLSLPSVLRRASPFSDPVVHRRRKARKDDLGDDLALATRHDQIRPSCRQRRIDATKVVIARSVVLQVYMYHNQLARRIRVLVGPTTDGLVMVTSPLFVSPRSRTNGWDRRSVELLSTSQYHTNIAPCMSIPRTSVHTTLHPSYSPACSTGNIPRLGRKYSPFRPSTDVAESRQNVLLVGLTHPPDKVGWLLGEVLYWSLPVSIATILFPSTVTDLNSSGHG